MLLSPCHSNCLFYFTAIANKKYIGLYMSVTVSKEKNKNVSERRPWGRINKLFAVI